MANTVWTVDEHCDALRERSEKARSETWFGCKTPRFKNIFDNKEEACEFLIKRAADGIERAMQDLKEAKARHAKCFKKYSPTPAAKNSHE